MNHRLLFTLLTTVLLSHPLLSQDQKPKPPQAPETSWVDLSDYEIDGQGWDPVELESRYDRFPERAKRIVTDKVWALSKQSAGFVFRFTTDSDRIEIKATVSSEKLANPNMTAIGSSGFDLYGLDSDKKWRWVGVTRPSGVTQHEKIVGLDGLKRSYALYFPLRQSVTSVEIGVKKGAFFEALPRPAKKPIVFYGTSITHGASASRPGMPHVAQVGRALDWPVMNLGFAGNGKMHAEVGALIGELTPQILVIDCLPNMTAELVAANTQPLVKQLRKLHPQVPIVLVEDRTFDNAWIKPTIQQAHEDRRAALRFAYDELLESGVKDLHYITGEQLLGEDSEATTDGSHPSDLGFVRQAEVFIQNLKPLLPQE